MISADNSNWQASNAQVFWGEIAPCNHLLQIYENDEVMLDALESFAASGFDSGESVVVIATAVHLKGLEERLVQMGYHLESLQNSHQFIPLEANKALEKFMVKDWPDEDLFMSFVNETIALAKGGTTRNVRAYGEMVAILWEQGHAGATVRLEHLWNKFCEQEDFCLFCAYPKTAFTQDIKNSIRHICSAHSKIISGDVRSTKEIYYQTV